MVITHLLIHDFLTVTGLILSLSLLFLYFGPHPEVTPVLRYHYHSWHCFGRPYGAPKIEPVSLSLAKQESYLLYYSQAPQLFYLYASSNLCPGVCLFSQYIYKNLCFVFVLEILTALDIG